MALTSAFAGPQLQTWIKSQQVLLKSCPSFIFPIFSHGCDISVKKFFWTTSTCLLSKVLAGGPDMESKSDRWSNSQTSKPPAISTKFNTHGMRLWHGQSQARMQQDATRCNEMQQDATSICGKLTPATCNRKRHGGIIVAEKHSHASFPEQVMDIAGHDKDTTP